MHLKVVTLTAILTLAACSGRNTGSNVKPPGEAESAKTNILQTGADLLQSKAPLNSLNIYMDGFHFYNGNMQGQMEAHHYCSVLNEDLNQCVIFDGNSKTSKIMGVEYIVTAKLYKTLGAEEKKLWHSHVFEVKSGQLLAPGIPEVAEHEFMQKMAGTYGKTWHTWHTDQQRDLPTGQPLLMMGFTDEGQINSALVENRDKRFNIKSADKVKNRADLNYPPIDPDADSWKTGKVLQLSIGPLTREAQAGLQRDHLKH